MCERYSCSQERETRGSEKGATEKGATEKGATENGATEKGATENGATENYATENYATENYATEKGRGPRKRRKGAPCEESMRAFGRELISCGMGEREPLKVVEAARQFGELCIDIAQSLPRRAPTRLRSQLAEAGQAVGDILVEGIGRRTTGEKLHYSRMANGSLEESQNYLRRCIKRQLIEKKAFYRSWNLSIAVSRMLAAFIAHLESEQEES